MLLLMAFLLNSAKSSAQTGPIIISIGKWLGNQVVGYVTGKTFDKLLGIDYEAQLKTVEANLSAQLRRGSGDAQRLRIELDATRSQLSILQALLNSKPTSNQLEQFRRQLTSDLAKVVKVQQEHVQRIAGLEKTSQDHETRIRKLEEAADSRTGNTQEGYRQGPSPKSGGEDFSRETYTPPAGRRARNSGVTLMVRVVGHSNEIYISETVDFERADIGSFEIEGMSDRYTLRLLRDTGGVINVQGNGNTVHLPGHLCGRIRVIRRGENCRVSGCE